jgi:GH24 family phage-related lysozyme (muramidase)
VRDSVRDAFVDFTTPLEGNLSWPYGDVKGLVTCGLGLLIDPIETAIGLPWTILGLRPASPDEIREGWNAVKARVGLTQHGGMSYKNVSHLRLSQDAITALVNKRLAVDEENLLHFFPQWADFPSDAQLGILSLAWAMGGAFAHKFPAFKRAANSGDWVTAAAESHISDGSPARNSANHWLFISAACVVADGGDFDLVNWPPPKDSA